MKKPKEPKKTSLDQEMEELALFLANKLRDPTTPMDERIGGFKALVGYWCNLHKLPPPPDDSKGAFGGFRDKISGLGRGNGAAAADPEAGPDF